MKLQSLELTDFKNYSQLSVDFDEHSPIILVGKNGQGKTNFLQAIVVLALSKSYQSIALQELVNWQAPEGSEEIPEFFRIKGSLDSNDGHKEMEVFCGRVKKYPKTLKINDLKTKPKDYVGNLRIVLFTPLDLNIVFLAPQLRRRYVDLLISQIDRDYLDHLSDYQGYLKHRNKLLSAIQEWRSKESELDYWDENMAKHGAYVLWKRREVFGTLNKLLSKNYENISSENVELKIDWKKEWEAVQVSDLEQLFHEYLLSKRHRDIEAGSTCGGPHREDFVFSMNDRDLADFGSRGECRSSVLALKLSELELIKDVTGDSPILLFDDVFSELDEFRQKNLLNLFKADQVFISSTHLDFAIENGVVWEVEEGGIILPI